MGAVVEPSAESCRERERERQTETETETETEREPAQACRTERDPIASQVNASVSGSGRSWIAPTREGSGDDGGGGRDSLSLLHASGPRTSPAVCWADVKAATERVMLRHMGEFVCGGCDCLDTLAGQVLV